MSVSTHSGEDYLSFGTLVRDFVSSVRLKAYDRNRKGDSSFFVFRFQYIRSDFLLGIETMMIATFIKCNKRAFSCIPEGVSLRNFFWGQAPRPPFISFSSAIILCFVLQQWAYVTPISMALGVSGKLANLSSI